jgi:hypothetical protein
VHLGRHLVASQLVDAAGPQLIGGGARFGCQLHERDDALTEPLVGMTDDRARGNTRVEVKNPLHLGRVHVGPTPDDEVGLAVLHDQAAIVDAAEIPGVQHPVS